MDYPLINGTRYDWAAASFKFGGSSFVTYGLRYRNDGTVTEHVNGSITITSLFGLWNAVMR